MEPSLISKRTKRWLIIFVIASLFYIPVIDPLANDLGAKAVIVQIVFSTIWLIAAILIYWIIRLTAWFLRRFSKESRQTLELPPNAFQVRVSLNRLHVIGLIFLVVVAALAGLAYRLMWQSTDRPTLTFLTYIVLLIVLHELSHGLGWIVRRIPVRSIKFGVTWHILAPYAHCRVAMPMTAYRFDLALPLFTTGLLPLGIGLWSRDFDLTMASAVLIGGAAGDLSMLLASIAFHPQSQVMHHPSEPAFIILDKGNLPSASGRITIA